MHACSLLPGLVELDISIPEAAGVQGLEPPPLPDALHCLCSCSSLTCLDLSRVNVGVPEVRSTG
jgi:hypothetical protein